MAKQRVIKYFLGPTFTDAQWTTRNPELRRGEVGFVIDGSTTKRCKVGPGRWNDLPWFNSQYYDYNEIVTNVIGDATGNLDGKTVQEILHLILNPYQQPLITNAVNNAGGVSFVNDQVIELGAALAGPLLVNYTVSNPDNLQGGTPINVVAGGRFNNEGNFANTGQISLTLSSPLNPSAPTIVIIQLRTTHLQGVSPIFETKFSMFPKIIWGNSPNPLMGDSTAFNALSNKKTKITNSYEQDYDFAGNGYNWIGIPAMLNPTDLLFTDVTNPEAPFDYSFFDMGSIVVNNGVGTYLYQLYRSEFLILSPSKARIRQAV